MIPVVFDAQSPSGALLYCLLRVYAFSDDIELQYLSICDVLKLIFFALFAIVIIAGAASAVLIGPVLGIMWMWVSITVFPIEPGEMIIKWLIGAGVCFGAFCWTRFMIWYANTKNGSSFDTTNKQPSMIKQLYRSLKNKVCFYVSFQNTGVEK